MVNLIIHEELLERIIRNLKGITDWPLYLTVHLSNLLQPNSLTDIRTINYLRFGCSTVFQKPPKIIWICCYSYATWQNPKPALT